MLNITIDNVNRDSPYKQAVIDIATGICTVDDGHEIETRLLASTMDFNHPLLTQPILHSSNHTYLYSYDDFDGLIDAAKFVYATLIQADNPLACEFKITPSAIFLRLKDQYQIHFSIDYKQPASERLSLEQLNLMISRFNGINFQYQDTICIDQLITVNDLPPLINGDLLYQINQEMAQFCKQADEMDKYELRYINRFIGFGVFAREEIKQGENISWYCGAKIQKNPVCKHYEYRPEHDALNLYIDAQHYGNMARFINHAPKESKTVRIKSTSDCLESNILNQVCSLYGNEVIIYVAKKDIKKGAQLLTNYGEQYFGSNGGELYMTRNGCVIDTHNKNIKESYQQRRQTLKIMSSCGIKQAQRVLIRKPAIVLGISLLLVLFLTRSQDLLSI